MTARKTFAIAFSVLVILALVFSSIPPSERAAGLGSLQERFRCPGCNVIIITADVFSPTRAGFGGSERNTTPNLDLFADKSIVFTKAFSPAISTFDSSVSVLSGKRLSEHGSFVVFGFESEVPPVETTIFERFSSIGYSTFISTNGVLPSSVTDENGFVRGARTEEYFKYLSREKDVLPAQVDSFILSLGKLKEENAPFLAFFETGFLHKPYEFSYVEKMFGELPYSGVLSNKSLEGLFRLERGVAYFDEMNLSFPVNSHDIEYLAARYDDKLLHLDREIGRILSFIENSGLSNNTLVVFTSYHGEALGEEGTFGHEYEFRAFRIPLIVGHPGIGKTTYPLPVELKDLWATVEYSVAGSRPVEETFLSGDGLAVMEAPFVDFEDSQWEKTFFSELDPSVRHSLNSSILACATDGKYFLEERGVSVKSGETFLVLREIDWETGRLSEPVLGIGEEELPGLFSKIEKRETRQGSFKPFLPRDVQFLPEESG